RSLLYLVSLAFPTRRASDLLSVHPRIGSLAGSGTSGVRQVHHDDFYPTQPPCQCCPAVLRIIPITPLPAVYGVRYFDISPRDPTSAPGSDRSNPPPPVYADSASDLLGSPPDTADRTRWGRHGETDRIGRAHV